MICVLCSVHVISTYYVRKGLWAFLSWWPTNFHYVTIYSHADFNPSPLQAQVWRNGPRRHSTGKKLFQSKPALVSLATWIEKRVSLTNQTNRASCWRTSAPNVSCGSLSTAVSRRLSTSVDKTQCFTRGMNDIKMLKNNNKNNSQMPSIFFRF